MIKRNINLCIGENIDMGTGVSSISAISVEELLGHPLNDVEKKNEPSKLYISGSMKIPIPGPRVSIVGSRKASNEGIAIAREIAIMLSKIGVIIVSGLAEGIDTSAHKSAISAGGKTIAVLGTPLNKTYPQKNLQLQQEIMKKHLVISQFEIGHTTTPKDFVFRNRTMALISDATIIVEAEDNSGSLHQGWEALRLGRTLFIWTSVVNNPKLKKPKQLIEYGAIELSNPMDVIESLPFSQEITNML